MPRALARRYRLNDAISCVLFLDVRPTTHLIDAAPPTCAAARTCPCFTASPRRHRGSSRSMAGPSARVLVVDPRSDGALARLVASERLLVTSEQKVEKARARIETAAFDVVVIDLGTAEAEAFVTEHAERFPEVPLIALEPESGASASSDAARLIAAEWLGRPLDAGELGPALERALTRAKTAGEIPPPPDVSVTKLLGTSPAIEKVRDLVRRAAPGDATVLVRGETGTGKELVARQLHELSNRRGGPFVKTHVAALPDNLIESELFGYEKGAFTGASARKAGRVELAQGGTLFLDEVGEISPAVQAKLLRLIQDREYERLGGTRSLTADVRFVAATHRDLEHMVEEGTFREDLFYRLNVVNLWIPPLRARRDDIPLLARAYISSLTESGKARSVTLDDAALSLLRSQRWPGNVRQLFNLVERVVVLATSPVVNAEDVRREFEEQVSFATQSTAVSGPEAAPEAVRLSMTEGVPSTVRPLREEVQRAERHALEKALASTKGNRSQAARLLGVSRRTLYTKLEEYGLE
jgi:two-component system, NtrC family, response regulator AtoC